MDGNRRWARQHKLVALQGHEYVSNQVIEPLAERCIARGVKYLTLWAFSTENWNREKSEVEGLLNIFRTGLQKNGEKLHKQGVRLGTIGNLEQFPADIQTGMQHWIDQTANNTRLTLVFALNYGGRDEILRAVKTITAEHAPAELQNLTQAQFSQKLDSGDLPDPDLIIRPGGEKRLSGFMPWQTVYSELYFTDILMPDFGPEQLDEALTEFGRRRRNFGR